MQPVSKKQAQPAVAKRLFQEACELSGGIMTTRVYGESVERAKYQGEPVVAATLALGSGASLRICLSPAMAQSFAMDVLGKLGVKPGPDASRELNEKEGAE